MLAAVVIGRERRCSAVGRGVPGMVADRDADAVRAAIEELSGDVTAAAGKLAGVKVVQEVLARILDGHRVRAGHAWRPSRRAGSGSPLTTARPTLLRRMQPTLDLDDAGPLPLPAHGSTAKGVLAVAEAMTAADIAGAIVLADDFGDDLDAASAELARKRRRPPRQAGRPGRAGHPAPGTDRGRASPGPRPPSGRPADRAFGDQRPVRTRPRASMAYSLYALWDDAYRPRLAALHVRPENDEKYDLFGDLRRLRNDAVHHGGIATSEETGKCVPLTHWFQPGQMILLKGPHFAEFFNQGRAGRRPPGDRHRRQDRPGRQESRPSGAPGIRKGRPRTWSRPWRTASAPSSDRSPWTRSRTRSPQCGTC